VPGHTGATPHVLPHAAKLLGVAIGECQHELQATLLALIQEPGQAIQHVLVVLSLAICSPAVRENQARQTRSVVEAHPELPLSA